MQLNYMKEVNNRAITKDRVDIEKKTMSAYRKSMEDDKKFVEDNMNYAKNKEAKLSSSRITQLLQRKEEAIAKKDQDTIDIIDAELFQMD